MNTTTVWVVGQKVNRVERFREYFGAVVYHYERCLFGAQFGMKGD